MKKIHKKIINECINKSIGLKKPLAIILGSTVNALSFARSLGTNRIPVLAIDCKEGVVGKSKFCKFISLSCGNDLNTYFEELVKIIDFVNNETFEAVIFATSDEWQIFLVNNMFRWNKIKSLLPSPQVINSIIDKQKQYELAETLKVSVPKFKNAKKVNEDISSWKYYPAIIKPRFAHLGRTALGGKVLVCKDQGGLTNALKRIAQIADLNDYLVQIVIQGSDDQLFGYLGLRNERGQDLAFIVKQKIRQNPPDFGDGSFQITVDDPKIVEISKKLLSGFDYCGLVGVEYKKDLLTGDIELIEINPRTVSGNQIAISSGANFPLIAYEYLIFDKNYNKIHFPLKYKIGVSYTHELWDYWSFKILRKRGQCGFIQWFSSVIRSDCYALWSISDPFPFLWSMYKLVLK